MMCVHELEIDVGSVYGIGFGAARHVLEMRERGADGNGEFLGLRRMELV